MNPVDIANLISEDIDNIIIEHRFKDVRNILMHQHDYDLLDGYGNPLFPSEVDDQFLTNLVAELNILCKGEFKDDQNLDQLAGYMKAIKKNRLHKSGPAGPGHVIRRMDADRYHGPHKTPDPLRSIS